MKKSKKIIVLVMVCVMLFGTTLTVQAAGPQSRCSCGAVVIKFDHVAPCTVTFSDGHRCYGDVYFWGCSNSSCNNKYGVEYCSSCKNMW